MNQLTPTITLWQGIGLLTTSLLGTSVFILPQLTVRLAGDGAVLAWLLLLLVMLPITWVFAQLGQRYPDAGGPATFVRLAFGARAGAAIGLLFLAVSPIGLPAAMMMTLAFAEALVPLTAEHKLALGIGISVSLVWISLRGLQLSGQLQLWLTGLILMLFALLLVGNLEALRWPQFDAIAYPSVLTAAGVALWAFLGIEAFSHLSAEFKRPQRDFLPAMMIGLLLVAAIYLVAAGLLLDGANGQPQGLAMAAVATHTLGPIGAFCIGGLGVLAGIATMNTYFNSMARLLWRLAEQGYLPRACAQLNQQRLPQRAMLLLASLQISSLVLAYGLAWDFEHLLAPSNGIFVLVYGLSMLAGYRLLERKNKAIALVAALLMALFGVSLGAQMIYGLVALAAVLLLLWWRKPHPHSAAMS